jgi:hypothetical protein
MTGGRLLVTTERYKTVKQVADILGVKPKSIYYLISCGKLNAHKRNRKLHVSLDLDFIGVLQKNINEKKKKLFGILSKNPKLTKELEDLTKF